MSLSHRERVLQALDHAETDRVPVDFGGGPGTLIHPRAYDALIAHLGLSRDAEPVESPEGEGQVVVPGELVLARFDVDVHGLPLHTRGGGPSEAPGSNALVDAWGVAWSKAGHDAPYRATRGPLQHLDEPGPADLASLPLPGPDDPVAVRQLRLEVERMRAASDRAVVLNLSNAALALAQRLRGFTEFLEDLLLRPAFATALQERVTDVICEQAASALDEVGALVDCVSFADDLGMQTMPYMSPRLYRSMVKPHHRRLVETMKARTAAKVIMHSDGAIADLLPDLVDIGVDVINPVQISAAGMDPGRLKREFGRDLCFWGGIDTQRILPYGSPAEVAGEVRRRLEDLGRGGGWVLASVHNIQAEVPPENIVAMYDAALGTAPR